MARAVAVSPTLKAAFVLLLALSVGGKIVIAGRSQPGGGRTGPSAAEAEAVGAFFARHGFQDTEVSGTEDLPSVRAAAGECKLLAILVGPDGYQRSIVRHLAAPGDRVLFVFNAVVYPDQPTWRTWTHFHWRVLNARVGRALPDRPALGIVASPTCDLRGLPWSEVAELP
jgi:hypothetical protein